MEARVIDFDGSLVPQRMLMAHTGATYYPARAWGPRIRLACSFRRFARFERALADVIGTPSDDQPHATWYGSGDFHHVSLALLRRLTQPFNLVVLDNHPDWMRFVPFLHCGTWLYHAARLPLLQRIIHVGGDVDFDNFYRALAPWNLLRSGKIVVVPAQRRYRRFPWRAGHEPLRVRAGEPAHPQRIADVLPRCGPDLARFPLYVSLDKDVMNATQGVVNWDSGHLQLTEVLTVLDTVCESARGRVAGLDIVGDWSPAVLDGWFRRSFDLTMHPALAVEPNSAARRNERANLRLLDTKLLDGLAAPAVRPEWLKTAQREAVAPHAGHV